MPRTHDVCCAGCAKGMSSARMDAHATVPLCRKCIPTQRATACPWGDVECAECGCNFDSSELGANGICICAHCAWGLPSSDIDFLVRVEIEAEQIALSGVNESPAAPSV